MIHRLVRISFVWGAVVLACGPAPAGAAEKRPAGMVCLVSGKASVVLSPADRRPLRLYDTVREKDVIETEAASGVRVALFTGGLYEVGEKARAEVRADRLVPVAGKVRGAGRVAAMPDIAPIAAGENAGGRMAAFRVRGDLQQRVVTDGTELNWPTDGPAREYHLLIQDVEERVVHAAASATPPWAVPPGLLKAETDYYLSVWVQEGERKRYVARWQPMYTIADRSRRAREELLKLYREGQDVSTLLLLADFDRQLGLCGEARREFQEASRLLPGNPAVQEAGSRFECPR